MTCYSPEGCVAKIVQRQKDPVVAFDESPSAKIKFAILYLLLQSYKPSFMSPVTKV